MKKDHYQWIVMNKKSNPGDCYHHDNTNNENNMINNKRVSSKIENYFDHDEQH